MTFESIQDDIISSTISLLDLARKTCHSTINDHCLYILSEVNHDADNFHIARKIKKDTNDKKKSQKLETILPMLQDIFHDLHFIDLYIYHAKKECTIIEIEYGLISKNNFAQKDADGFNYPYLHGKINILFWIFTKEEKFDINWQHKAWLIRWEVLKYRISNFLKSTKKIKA
jgi:hypothetical protein